MKTPTVHPRRQFDLCVPHLERLTKVGNNQKFPQASLGTWLALVSAVLLLTVWATGCSKSATPQIDPSKMQVPVAVAHAVTKTVPLQIRVIGNVEPFETVSVKSQVGGELTKVHFSEGQDVTKNQLLFEIDARPYQQALNQAQANLSRDTAQALQAEANLSRDSANLANADSDARRYAQLHKEGVASQQQDDQYRTAAEALRAGLKADRAAIESANAAVQSDMAAIERAKLDLAYCSIRSPLDGRTGKLNLHAGNVVKVNDDTLVIINQIAPISISFNVPQEKLGLVRKYQSAGVLPVEAVVPSGEASAGGKRVTGTLSFIDNTVDTNTGTIRLKARFANTERLLWPGQFIDVIVTLADQKDATVVPSEAVQAGQQGQYAYVVKADHRVEIRPLEVGRTVGPDVVINKGIAPGETVVTDGQLRLFPGALVQVTKTPPSPQSAPGTETKGTPSPGGA